MLTELGRSQVELQRRTRDRNLAGSHLSDILSGILSGISSDILSDIFSDILPVEVQQCPLRSGSRG